MHKWIAHDFFCPQFLCQPFEFNDWHCRHEREVSFVLNLFRKDFVNLISQMAISNAGRRGNPEHVQHESA